MERNGGGQDISMWAAATAVEARMAVNEDFIVVVRCVGRRVLRSVVKNGRPDDLEKGSVDAR